MKKNLRVLLFVSSDFDARLIEDELSQGGFKPVCERIQNSDMLFETISKSRWDFIVSDISSPLFDLTQAIELLNEKRITVPFIAVSDDCREDIIVRLIKAGAWDFINKKNLKNLPVSVRNLLNVPKPEKKPAHINGNNSGSDFDDLMDSGRQQSNAATSSLEVTEKMLKISQVRYQTLFDQAPTGIFIATRDGRLIDANPAYASMLGYDSPEDAISIISDLALDVYTDPNVRHELISKLKEQNETAGTETKFRRKDGSEIYVNVTLKVISDDNSTDLIIGQVVDVTNLRNIQKSLLETEARFRNTLRNVPISVFNQDKNLVYNFIFNPKVENAPDIVIGKTDYDLFTPDQAKRLIELKKKVLDSGLPERELIIIDYEGKEIYVDLSVDPIIDENGIITGVTGVSLDLTDKIKSDEALRLSERHYRELVEGANSIILRWQPDGTVKYMNDFGLTFFGYEAHELIGKSVNTLVPDKDKSGHDLSSLINEILNNTDSYRYNENDNVLRSGEIVTVSWSNRAITDDQGNVVEILAIGNDITDLKKKEDELKLLNEKLEIKVQERTVELEATVDDLIAEVSERIRIQEELRAKEEEFRSLVEFSPDIIIKFDAEGRYVYVNPRHALEMGLSDDEILGRTALESGMTRERAEEWQEAIMKVFGSGFTAELERPFESAEGIKWFYIKFSPVKDESGKVISVIAVLRNITEIVNIREEIRSKEELYRALIENTPDIVSVCDRNLKYSFVNSAIERSLGINPADIIGKSNSEINQDNENIDTWESNLKWVFRHKKNKSFELPYKSKNGLKWFYVIFVPLFDNGGKVDHVLTISRDIDDLKQKEFELKRHKENLEEIVAERTEDLKLTNEKLIAEINERKLVESRLSLSEERFRIALQNAPISVLSQDTNLKIDWIYQSRFGFDTENIIGKTDYELFEKNDADKLNSVKQKAIRSGKPNRQEIIVSQGGQKHYLDMTVEPVFDSNGVISGIITASIDITNTRLKEDELRIKDAAIRSSINGIAISNLEGNVTYVNKSCLDIWGYDDPEEVVGQPLFRFIDLNKNTRAMPPYTDGNGNNVPTEDISLEDKLRSVIENLSSDKGWIGEVSAIKKDGSNITVQTSANIVLDDKGQPICMMASFIDATDKKKMEEALRESERRYRILFEQAPNGIFLSTIEGSLLDLNPAYARMLGFKNSDEALRLIKNVATDVYLDIGRRDEIIEMVKQNPDYVRSEARYKTRDGRIIDVMLTIKSILNPNGRPAYLIGHAEDITELKNAEKNRSLLSAIVESSGNAIISSDLEGNIMSWNKAAEIMYGYSRDEIIGKSVFELIPADKKEELSGFLYKMKNGEMIEQYESLRKRKDGSLLPVSVIDSPVVDNMNHIIGFSFIAQDLTPIKKAESAYKESMDRLRIALQYTPITIFSHDLDLVITWVYNPPFGLSADKLIGRKDSDIFNKDDSGNLMLIKRHVIETGIPAREEVTINYNDAKHHFDLTVEPMIDGWGSVIGITCALIDITEKKEHEQERQRQEIAQVLEKSARLASVGVLAGGITHEINQPLNAIRMGSDGILLWNKRNKSVLPDIITDMLLGVSNACKRIEEIILNMRSLWSGLHQENMQTININESAQRAVSLLMQKLHNHGIAFEIKLSDESLYILANLLQIELIINNLVVNSIYSVDKARSKGKSIILETNGDERYIYLNVRDNGLGLPDVQLDKLFDPFFTTKPPEEGSGLGLAIVKMFVNRFEGKIDAYNNEEGGATFAIRFPRKKLME